MKIIVGILLSYSFDNLTYSINKKGAEKKHIGSEIFVYKIILSSLILYSII